LANDQLMDKEIIVQQIQKRIDELMFPSLTSLTNKEKNEELKQIKQVLENYLTRYKNAAILINKATANLNLENIQGKKEKALNLYILYKQLINNLDLSSLLQDGYILIENLRKTFTDKEIQYDIGMRNFIHKEYILLNKKISLAELLSYAKVDIQ